MTKEQKVSLITWTQLSRSSTTPLIGGAGAAGPASHSDVPMYLLCLPHTAPASNLIHASDHHPPHTHTLRTSTDVGDCRAHLLSCHVRSQPLALPKTCLPHANGSMIFASRCAVPWEYARLCCGTKDRSGGDGCRKHSSSHEGRNHLTVPTVYGIQRIDTQRIGCCKRNKVVSARSKLYPR